MQSLLQSTAKLQKILADAHIPSAVIGGLAVAIWGEPRLTRDADLKVLLERDRAQQLITLLSKNYTCVADDPVKTLQQRGLLFVLDADRTRLDLLLGDTPFDAKAIERARSIEVAPALFLIICSAEDLLLYKMISTRPRDREDARGIIRRQGKALDDVYIIDWLKQFEQAFHDSTLVKEYQAMRQV